MYRSELVEVNLMGLMEEVGLLLEETCFVLIDLFLLYWSQEEILVIEEEVDLRVLELSLDLVVYLSLDLVV